MSTESQLGRCKLCLLPRDLCESHLIAKGFYKQLRDPDSANQNPHLVTADGSVQTSKQVTAQVLCTDCEQRFAVRGEEWVIAHCRRRDGFPIQDVLTAAAPVYSNSSRGLAVFAGQNISDIKVAELIYFAVSVFWRGGVHHWSSRPTDIHLPLGPYLEPLRRFLYLDEPFPAHASLIIWVAENREISAMQMPMLLSRDSEKRVYRFGVPGITFDLLVGRAMARKTKELSSHRPPHLIWMSSQIERMSLAHMAEMVRQPGDSNGTMRSF